MKYFFRSGSKIKNFAIYPAHQIMFDLNYENFYANKPNTIPLLGIRIKRPFQEVCRDANIIFSSKMIEIPPYTVPPVEIDLSLAKNKKTLWKPH